MPHRADEELMDGGVLVQREEEEDHRQPAPVPALAGGERWHARRDDEQGGAGHEQEGREERRHVVLDVDVEAVHEPEQPAVPQHVAGDHHREVGRDQEDRAGEQRERRAAGFDAEFHQPVR